MKKFFSLLISTVLLLCVFLFCGCESDKVSVKYFSSASDLIPLLKAGNIEYGLLPEPSASKLKSIDKNNDWYFLDIQNEYDNVKKGYPQAVIMAKQNLLDAYPNLETGLNSYLQDINAWIKQDISRAVDSVNSKIDIGVVPSLSYDNVSDIVVDNCKIYFESSALCKQSVKDYIEDIIKIDSASAKSVTDEFFYSQGEGKFSKDSISVYAPDGAPALAISKLIYNGYDFTTEKTVNYNVVLSSDIGKSVIQEKADVVILPVNAATKLYNSNQNNPYKTLGVITHGNLYLVSKTQISLQDIVGEKVGVIGQGNVPDLTFRAILNKNNIKFKVAD